MGKGYHNTVGAALFSPKSHKRRSAGGEKLKESRLLRKFGVRPKDLPAGKFNPFIYAWTVNGYRSNYAETRHQDRVGQKAELQGYSKDLFESMFKGWG